MTMLEERTAPGGREGDPLVPVFVYGTLRVGQYNFSWAQEAVVDTIQNCTAKGALYFVDGRFGYPVAKFDEEGEIKGDVLWFDPAHEEYQSVVRMELGAGYEVREIEVRTESETIEAIAFHYLRPTRGNPIPDGDWVKANDSWDDDEDDDDDD